MSKIIYNFYCLDLSYDHFLLFSIIALKNTFRGLLFRLFFLTLIIAWYTSLYSVFVICSSGVEKLEIETNSMMR